MNGNHGDGLTRGWRRRDVLVLAVASLTAAARPAFARDYKSKAMAMISNLPEDAEFRPDLEAELLRLANAYRAQKRLPVLAEDTVFAQAARAQAADMMLNNFIGHTASDGTPFERRLRAMGGAIERFGTVGENAARDSKKTPVDTAKAAALFQQWVESRPHRANLKKSDYAFAATGVVQRGSTIWAIQIFRGVERKGMFFFGNNATVNQ